MSQPPYPLHPSVEPHLSPDYKSYYIAHLQHTPPVHHLSVSKARESGLPPGRGPMQPVGRITDFSIPRQETSGPPVDVRVFVPEGEPPVGGWAAVLYLHGGGWVLGGLDTENVVCSHVCSRVGCVVVSVDYRLAPENPFPAAVHDSLEALHWLRSTLPSLIPLNLSKLAIGGSSAGGNLAAVVTQTLAARNENPTFLTQFLIVPVLDNTATVETNATWNRLQHTPALPAAKMLWYRRHYLPDEKDWTSPDASPLLWTGDWTRLPPALMVMGGMDLLRGEGEEYAAKLQSAGVRTDVRVVEGMPHPFLAMDGVLRAGREAITAICETVKAAFEG